MGARPSRARRQRSNRRRTLSSAGETGSIFLVIVVSSSPSSGDGRRYQARSGQFTQACRKLTIQALDRTQPGLPWKKGRCGTMTHDYKRNGTTTLFAALELLEGKVIGQCYTRHRHQEFLKFLHRLDREFPGKVQLHLVMDNYGTHKTPQVQTWLKRHPRFVPHFVPTSSSWLNLVERWFGELTSKRIRRGRFASVPDLKAAIEGFLEAWNEQPKPFIWTATVESILTKLSRCRQTLEQIQPGCTLPRGSENTSSQL